MNNKIILDACCGSRMFWFDKNNEHTLFMDKRNEILIAKDSSKKKGERIININPDFQGDFTDMVFPNETSLRLRRSYIKGRVLTFFQK